MSMQEEEVLPPASSAEKGCAVFRNVQEVPEDFGPSVVTVGNFDGVHCGHRSVIAEVVSRAQALQVRSVLVTFDPHPVQILRPDVAPKLLTPGSQKIDLLRQTGLNAILVLPFTAELAKTSARGFAETILQERLRALEVHEGENFRFGYQAEASVDGLAALGRELGFTVQTYVPIQVGRGIVSSSRIRQALAAGDVRAARHLLGRPYAIRSTPARGRGYGTKYAVPTINLAEYVGLLPANGVYVTELRIGEGDSALRFDAVTNIGNRPTFGADSFAVESYLLRFRPVTLTEETPLELTFLKRLRKELKWTSPEALKAQIGLDVARAERWFALRRVLARLPVRT